VQLRQILIFDGHCVYFGNCTTCGNSYYGILTGNQIRSVKLWHYGSHWTTNDGHFSD